MTEGFVFGPSDTRMEMASGDRLLIGPNETGGLLSVMMGTIAGPEGPPLHTHDEQDELTFVVAGGPLTVQLDGEIHEIGAGGGYWAPRGVAHTFANFSPEPAVYVSVSTPGGMENMLHEQARYFQSLAPGEAPDMQQIAAIAAAHKSSPVGPPLAAVHHPIHEGAPS